MSIGFNKHNLAKLGEYDNCMYVKQNHLNLPITEALICYFTSIRVNINITCWILYSVCIKLNVIGIFNLEINLADNNTVDLFEKIRYILANNIKKDNFKSKFF